ncbi:hypothetical protein BDV10DRAFT_170962 [Aspergillus recurvatus]
MAIVEAMILISARAGSPQSHLSHPGPGQSFKDIFRLDPDLANQRISCPLPSAEALPIQSTSVPCSSASLVTGRTGAVRLRPAVDLDDTRDGCRCGWGCGRLS